MATEIHRLSFRNLVVCGKSGTKNVFSTFASAPLAMIEQVTSLYGKEVPILHGIDGLIKRGELVLVLGRPGSGCSTLLKTLAGQTAGLTIGSQSKICYDNNLLPLEQERFRGRCIYSAETDIHFPDLTVGETLEFASRSTSELGANWESIESSLHLCSASHTVIGNAVKRGISGGEKRRVTLGETLLSNAVVQCWDNSTRGMDSATALAIMQTIRDKTILQGSISVMSLYQASQPIVNLFHKVLLLYEGHQIFFGTMQEAVDYFTKLGFDMPHRMSTADYLTAVTSPREAKQLARQGAKDLPQSKDDFVQLWQRSVLRHNLIQLIEGKHIHKNGLNLQAGSQSGKIRYHLPISRQIAMCIGRCCRRILNSYEVPLSTIVGNAVLAAIVGGLFLNLDETSATVTTRSNLLFLSVFVIWDQRPIVEKHARYALYRPMAESFSAVLCDLPIKFVSSLVFNTILYFMTNLRRSAEAFFTYWLFVFICHITLSTWFRCAGSFCKTFGQLTVPLGLWHLALITYSGYVIPVNFMRAWLHWIRYLNPMTYAFESMIINEFQERTFPCQQLFPSGPEYENTPPDNKICAQIDVGSSVIGTHIDGSMYISQGLGLEISNLWRNLGILLVLMLTFLALHLLASEYILAMPPVANMLLFPRKSQFSIKQQHRPSDEESFEIQEIDQKQGAPADGVSVPFRLHHNPGIFQWAKLNYEIPRSHREKPLRILSNLSGFIESGTLTALMGATGAGKTTLLNALAGHTSTGNVSGEITYHSGNNLRQSFPKIGYVQQQDIHLTTSTVREALQFSARMRLAEGNDAEKMEFVEEIIKLLCMSGYANAMIGAVGQGLNVEQLRRLTIAVELVAKPDILFLDEPTSGLDSQTAWAICSLLRDLARQGQTILCTLHQPSARLFDMFDKLYLIQGGRTLYHGEIGVQAQSVIDYFQPKAKDTKHYTIEQNPAEWIFDLVSEEGINWSQIWERETSNKFTRYSVKHNRTNKLPDDAHQSESAIQPRKKFSLSLFSQIVLLTKRTFISYWRTPQYLWCNILYSVLAATLISVSCPNKRNGIQGLKTQLFALFLFCTIFSNLSHQILPKFVNHRELFEIREGRSRIYSWKAFLSSMIIVEAFWMTISSALAYVLFFYPLGMYHGRSEDALLAWLYIWIFFLFTSTMSHLLMAGIEHAELAASYGFLLFYLCLIFCGVLVPKNQLPQFWVFMYRVSPLTYFIAGLSTVGISERPIDCLENEYLVLDAPRSMTCGEYLTAFIGSNGGKLLNPQDSSRCRICPVIESAEFLHTLNISRNARWEYLGYFLIFVIFNIVTTFLVYWVARASKMERNRKIKAPISDSPADS